MSAGRNIGRDYILQIWWRSHSFYYGLSIRPSIHPSIHPPIISFPTRRSSDLWDRFHQQGKNLFRKEIRGKIGVNHFSYFLPFNPQGSDEWNQSILSRVFPLRLKMAWSGLGQKGAMGRGRPGPLLDERTGISLEECGSGSSRHRRWSPTLVFKSQICYTLTL